MEQMIYVVMHDKQIEGLFDTRSEAEEYQDHYLFDSIKEMPLNPNRPGFIGKMYQGIYYAGRRLMEVKRISNEWGSKPWEVDRFFCDAVCYFNAASPGAAAYIIRQKVKELKDGEPVLCKKFTNEGSFSEPRFLETREYYRLDGDQFVFLYEEDK